MSSLFNGVSSLSSLLVLLAGLGGFMRTALLGSAAFATCFAAAFGRPRFFGTGLGSVTATVSVVSSVTASVVFLPLFLLFLLPLLLLFLLPLLPPFVPPRAFLPWQTQPVPMTMTFLYNIFL